MSIVEQISVCVVCVPLDRTTSFATRTVLARHYCLVKILDSDGREGIGFCYVGHAAGNLARLAVEELLAPRILGQDPHRIEGLWEEMYQEAILHGRAGTVMRALSSLDIALWDLNARSAELPLHRLLGYAAKQSVPAYASGGYYLQGKDPEKLGEEVGSYVKQGFKAVKIKVGRLGVEEETNRVCAAREAIGTNVMLLLDANNAWADVPTAMNYCRAFARYAPYWIEEPFSPDDIDSHARLAECSGITVATGEIEAGRWRFAELLRKRGAEILQADAAVCGGITEWRKIAAIASSYGVKMSPHWFHDLHIHLVASISNAGYVEFFPDDQVLNFRRLISSQLETKDGELLLPQGCGLGFNFDEEAVAKYALTSGKPWTTVSSSQE